MNPIAFSDDRAFNHLDNEGYVFTFRESRRAEPNGKVWVSRGRTEPKEFEGEIREVERDIFPESKILEQYSDNSGFGRVDDWREAIRELNGGQPETGFIYQVDKEDES